MGMPVLPILPVLIFNITQPQNFFQSFDTFLVLAFHDILCAGHCALSGYGLNCQ
jgi:hypothetical protein